VTKKQASKKRADALTLTKNRSNVARLSNTDKGNTMTQQTAQTAPKPATTKPANGSPVAAPESKEAAQASEETRKKAGIIPTMPAAVIYQYQGAYHAVVHHPGDKSTFAETGKGIGAAKGALEDSGFVLSSLQADGPEWIRELVPEGAVVQGYATIKGFPLPKQ